MSQPAMSQPAPPLSLDQATLRLIDANVNRAQEGLRVVEDYLRFVVNDPSLAVRCKEIRHEIRAASETITDTASLVMARDAEQDVGRDTKTQSEFERSDPIAVVRANLKRGQQSLRSLEEWSKTVQPDCARQFELLRYRVYVIESQIEQQFFRPKWLEHAWLYVLIDGAASLADFRSRVEVLVAEEVCVIQLRDKKLDDKNLMERATALRQLTASSQTAAIVNDRPDIAVIANLDGVHVGQEDLSVRHARQVIGRTGVVGRSTHSVDQARDAVAQGADYIGVGPIFPSKTKQFTDYLGTELLKNVSANVQLPAFAIGGITPEGLSQVFATGVRRIAVSQAIWGANRISEGVARFKQARSDAIERASSDASTGELQ